MKNEIIIFEEGNIKLDVNLKDETVWLSQKQMQQLFNVKHNTISDHISNIFAEGELEEKTSVGISDKSSGGRKPQLYNLDVIISVGYRVNSKRGVAFRKWATSVLKEHMLEGYTINLQRLAVLEKTVKLIEIANRNEEIENNEAKNILNTIGKYTKALDLLDQYDYKSVKKPKGTQTKKLVTYENCIEVINKLKFNEKSSLFARERDKGGLNSIINNIYQSFDGKDVYKSVEEKASNLLYLTVKNHVFVDGNKRIAAALFIYFLHFNNILKRDNENIIDNNTLVALTLMIANSNPKEKDIIIDLVMNFLSK